MCSQFTRSEELLGQADKYLIRLPLFSLSLFNRLYVAHSMQRCAISYKLEAETTSLKSDLLNLQMIVEKARFCILIVPQERIGCGLRRCVTQSCSEWLTIRTLIHSHLLTSERGLHLTETFYTTCGVPRVYPSGRYTFSKLFIH